MRRSATRAVALAAIAAALWAGHALVARALQPTAPPTAIQFVAASPVPVPRKPGEFDYMTTDEKYGRLLAAHSGNDALAIVDMDAQKTLQQVELGGGAGGAGVAVDVRDGKYFVGTADDHVVDVNRKNMVLQAYITMPGPVDAIAFDPKNDTLYADEDDGTHVWAVDAKTDKIVATIPIPGKPEYVQYDPVSDRVYQNIDLSPSSLLVIDPATNTVVTSWPVAPANKVHGLVVDGASGRAFTIGLNGKLAVIDVKTGTLVTAVDVAERVDQIAFDPGAKRVYCPSGTGVMSVVQETADGATLLGTVVIPRHSFGVAVDPRTRAVWIAFGGEGSDYVQRFTPTP